MHRHSRRLPASRWAGQGTHPDDSWSGSTNAYARDDGHSLQRAGWLDTTGDSGSAKRFRDANHRDRTSASPEPDCVLRAHADKKYLQGLARSAANGPSGMTEARLLE